MSPDGAFFRIVLYHEQGRKATPAARFCCEIVSFFAQERRSARVSRRKGFLRPPEKPVCVLQKSAVRPPRNEQAERRRAGRESEKGGKQDGMSGSGERRAGRASELGERGRGGEQGKGKQARRGRAGLESGGQDGRAGKRVRSIRELRQRHSSLLNFHE